MSHGHCIPDRKSQVSWWVIITSLLLCHLCCCCSGGRLEVQESDPEEPASTAWHCGIIQHRSPVRSLLPTGIWRQPRMGQKSTWNALRYFICDRMCMNKGEIIEYCHKYSNPASLLNDTLEYYLWSFLQNVNPLPGEYSPIIIWWCIWKERNILTSTWVSEVRSV